MVKSIEDMAREKLERYLTPLKTTINGKEVILSPGFSPMVAARKAASASPNFSSEIYKIAEKMKEV